MGKSSALTLANIRKGEKRGRGDRKMTKYIPPQGKTGFRPSSSGPIEGGGTKILPFSLLNLILQGSLNQSAVRKVPAQKQITLHAKVVSAENAASDG